MQRTPARATLKLVVVASQEATRKACGVLVAMLLGQSWAPYPVNRCVVNVGTIRSALTPGRPGRERAGPRSAHGRMGRSPCKHASISASNTQWYLWVAADR